MLILDLPTGRRGQLLALGMTLAVLGGIWIGIVAPLLNGYEERAVRLENRLALARRMAALVEALPELRSQAQSVSTGMPIEQGDILEGASDALAAAELQEQLQAMATQVGAPLRSVEVLPAEAVGAYRRLRVRVAVSAPWPGVVRLLQAVAQATPRMLVDDLQLRASPVQPRLGSGPVEAAFTVIAFRAAAGEASR